MDMRLCALLTGLVFAYAATAQQAAPSDNDLHTAYCVPIIQAAVEVDRQVIAQLETNGNSPIQEVQQSNRKLLDSARESLGRTQNVLNRLQFYLLPKMQTLDPAAWTAAMRRGEADVLELKASTLRCTSKCPRVPLDDNQRCMASCTDAALVARVQACHNPTWLPF